MKKLDCKKWWGYKHSFGKWTVFDEKPLIINNAYTLFESHVVGKATYQKRTCKACGYTEINKQVTE